MQHQKVCRAFLRARLICSIRLLVCSILDPQPSSEPAAAAAAAGAASAANISLDIFVLNLTDVPYNNQRGERRARYRFSDPLEPRLGSH